MIDSAIKPLQNHRAVSVVDLFCGVGGLTFGLKEAGLTVVAGIDLDPSCKFPLEQNTDAKFICQDVAKITSFEVAALFPQNSVRVLAGCAPCQPFSTYSQSRKSADARWDLLTHFQRIAEDILPEIITMENVPGLAKRDVWFKFVGSLESLGYLVDWSVVKCVDLGLPQTRRRLVLIASKIGAISVSFPKAPTQTVRDALFQLPRISAGEKCSSDPIHIAPTLSVTNQIRISSSIPGGTWRDWPLNLVAPCHKRETGTSYPSVYGRMEWDKPSPTMTTQCYAFGSGRFGHPEQNRAISLREAAILQSFPKEYQFLPKGEKTSFRRLGTLIGNAVPPKLGIAIGKKIVDHLDQLPPKAANR